MKTIRKTTKEWLETLPDGYRERALQAFEGQGKPNDLYKSLGDAIMNGFYWDNTVEGESFWHGVYSEYKYNEGNLPAITNKEIKEFAIEILNDPKGVEYSVKFWPKEFGIGCQTFTYMELRLILDQKISGRVWKDEGIIKCRQGSISEEWLVKIAEVAKKLGKIT
jgi:hypothetical protein